MSYICVAEAKEVFNIKGESLGIERERSLYYLKGITRHRIYRDSYPSDQKCFVIKKYKSQKKAQILCDIINHAYNDNFKVREIKEG